MNSIPEPIFKKNLHIISWDKIYEREYGVQYSEVAISLLASAKYHFPETSFTQIVIPGSGGTAFYIDAKSWIKLVEGLNQKYTIHVKNLEEYEKQFIFSGKAYLKTAKYISRTIMKSLSNQELLSVFINHQGKRYRYSAFAWSAFILNNYVADRATIILETYLKKHDLENEKQQSIDSLFNPYKRAAVLELQYEVQKHNGKPAPKELDQLYNRFKWLSCLDIQNKPWTKKEFENHIKSFKSVVSKKITPFEKYIKELKFKAKDLEYLLMAKRFVYIKDARDDYRRESVFYANSLFKEIGRRMEISTGDVSYLQEKEIIDFLSGNKSFDNNLIFQRKKGFVIYLDKQQKLICLEGNRINKALRLFNLLQEEIKSIEIMGRVASQGKVKGKVAIVQTIKDLAKIETGNILVAVTTHPDFVPAMRKSAAIITEEGGITSHAAIVSREFGIPCIVGCKNATKFLKDGDFVEVDAIKGRVIKCTT